MRAIKYIKILYHAWRDDGVLLAKGWLLWSLIYRYHWSNRRHFIRFRHGRICHEFCEFCEFDLSNSVDGNLNFVWKPLQKTPYIHQKTFLKLKFLIAAPSTQCDWQNFCLNIFFVWYIIDVICSINWFSIYRP